MATFPAMNFIQNGKIDRKFNVFCEEYAILIETSGNIYCYSTVKEESDKESESEEESESESEEGSELEEAGTSTATIKTCSQYLVQLNEEILGWSYEMVNERDDKKEILFILTSEKIYRIKLQ